MDEENISSVEELDFNPRKVSLFNRYSTCSLNVKVNEVKQMKRSVLSLLDENDIKFESK